MKIEISALGMKLILWGAILFLVGLLQGALIPYFPNSRMALSAHLAAVQSGMALIIFGLIWGFLVLQERWLKITFYASVTGMYTVWFAIPLAAILGASKALPIAGAGFSTTPLNEMLVQVIVSAGAGLGVLSTGLIVLGLIKGLNSKA